MSEQNKAIYTRFLNEVFSRGKLELVDELLSPSYTYHDAPPGTPPGRDGIRAVVTMFRKAFPDLNITIEDQIAERDLVCSRTTMRGTHKGSLMGETPTGKAVEMRGLTLVRVVNGKVTDSWVKNDVMSLMNQIGATAQR